MSRALVRGVWALMAAMLLIGALGMRESHVSAPALAHVVDERVECIGGDQMQRQGCENSLARMRDAVPLATYQIYTMDCGPVSCCLVPDE